jgi:hypothetical protein
LINKKHAVPFPVFGRTKIKNINAAEITVFSLLKLADREFFGEASLELLTVS